ncbi:MAG: hypothetical protein IJT73_06005 [Selenomonadaceae bacterium]|nr:hypothetical protein [Selenomonadaceae bacterium]
MKENLAKILLATGIIFSSTTATTFAAETENQPEPPKKINIPIERKEVEPPEFLVKGAIKDLTQKILPISVEARYFVPHMDLQVKSDSIFYNGGEVGLKGDLGFGNDNAPEVIFRYKRFTADYFTIHGTGDRNFSGSDVLTFGGGRYHGDTHSQSDLHYLKLQVTNPVISVLGSGVDWSYGLSGIYWKGKVSGTEVGTGNSISSTKEFGAPIPTLGIGAHASLLDTLLFNVHLSGLPLGGHGHFYDFEAGLRYNPLDLLSISLGYRKIHANIKYHDDSGTLDLDGPYAGLRFDF